MASQDSPTNQPSEEDNFSRAETGHSSDSTIVISNLSRRYGNESSGVWALRKVNMRIEPGIFGLLGRNGAGKTTLL